MPNNLLYGCFAKLQRAKFHLEELTNQLDADGREQRYGVSFGFDLKTKELVIKAKKPRELFVRYSIIAGEVVHQLRSALDHVVWQLVIANGCIPTCSTCFPVYRDRKKYLHGGITKIDGVNSAAATIIEGLQSFGSDYASDPLYILNEMWNRDKHRLLNLIVVNSQAFTAIYRYPSGETRQFVVDLPSVSPSLEDGTELQRLPLPPDYSREVKVVGMLWVPPIQFEDAGPAPGHKVSELLPKLAKFTEDVINRLAETISLH